MSPESALTAIGVALYGPRWQTQLATDVGVSDRTVRRWVSGEDTPRLGVLLNLRDIMTRKREQLEKLERVIAWPTSSSGARGVDGG